MSARKKERKKESFFLFKKLSFNMFETMAQLEDSRSLLQLA